MNEIWQKNITLFLSRFPALAGYLGVGEGSLTVGGGPNPEYLLSASELEIVPSRRGNMPTARAKDGDGKSRMLHSLYDPVREAEQAADSVKKTNPDSRACAFFSFGLGYPVVAYARKFPDDALIVVEPNPKAFFTALSAIDWSPVFNMRDVTFAIATGADVVVSLLERAGGLLSVALFQNQAHTMHASAYYCALSSQIERNRDKERINAATFRRFSALWKKNIGMNSSVINARVSSLSDFVSKNKESLSGRPFVVVAAGPSLSEILPHLKEMGRRAFIVAVDTALRSCLDYGVEPDFVVLCDPQFYAYRHIAGLSSPSSVLVTEAAVYPPALRFRCREIVMCASNCPLEMMAEKGLVAGEFVREDRKRGILSSGGSVSTTAWEFARVAGASEIYMAGLDLGYPENETHVRGSTFEELAHSVSSRLFPAETFGAGALFGANMMWAEDYGGRKILTDNRMKMFAWWFESRCTSYPKLRTYSMSSRSLKIPGITVRTREEFFENTKDFRAVSEN